jgi:SAM-dependent methyltransferase
MMRRAYTLHEREYRKMRAAGVAAWDEREPGPDGRRHAIDPNTRRFLDDVLAQTWLAKAGSAIEFGCGTGPMLRHVCRGGWAGLGIDISRTAIAMAREQSVGLPIRYRVADVCRPALGPERSFDLVIDGHCLHCITQPGDRKAFLRNVRRLLKPRGVFLMLTMCGPVDRKAIAARFAAQRLIGSVLYVPYEKATEFTGARHIQGRAYLPIRYVAHWRRILGELRAARFEPSLIRLSKHSPDDPISDLAVAART